MNKMSRLFFSMCAIAVLSSCAHSTPYEPQDPLEVVNRKIYSFNEAADGYVFKPVAKAYVKVTPSPVRDGVGNFLSNLFYPTVIVNNVLQGKLVAAAQDVGRFIINSTLGVAGFADVATTMGVPTHDEDFGQTLAHWGVGPGWYLMLPFLGPSTNRDFVGNSADAYTSVTAYIEPEASLGLAAVDAIDTRAGLLGADNLLQQQFDRYIAVRTGYLQNRESKIYDGNPPQEEFTFDDE